MTDIDKINLRRLDLTMLMVFLALMRRRKATTVAEEMGLTQSSVSHTLGRLRGVFGDPLFLRRPFGLEPTARAAELEPLVQAAVDRLSDALRGGRDFEPANATDTVRIGAFDAELAVPGAALLARVRRVAPGLALGFRNLGRSDALAALERREIDLALGYFWEETRDAIRTPLLRESYRVVAREGHALMRGEIDLGGYVAAEHLVVSPSGDFLGIVDRHLREMGLRRRVAATMPLFMPALAALAETDLVATLPARIAAAFGPRFGLAVREPPLAIRSFEISALIHRRNDKSRMHRWLVGQLSEIGG